MGDTPVVSADSRRRESAAAVRETGNVRDFFPERQEQLRRESRGRYGRKAVLTRQIEGLRGHRVPFLRGNAPSAEKAENITKTGSLIRSPLPEQREKVKKRLVLIY